MPNALRLIAPCLALALWSAGAAPSAAASPDPRAAALVAAFSSWCLAGPPDFAAEDRRAAAAGDRFIDERTARVDPNGALRQKSWLVPDPTGAFALMGQDLTGAGPHRTACGVAALDADGEAVTAALAALRQMGPPKQRLDPAPGGGVAVVWDVGAAGGQVTVAFGRTGQKGTTINLMSQQPAAGP